VRRWPLIAILAAGCGGSDPPANEDLAVTTSTPAPHQISVPKQTSRPTPVPTPTPARTPSAKPVSIAGLSALQLLSKAQTAAKAQTATSVRVKGTMSDGGQAVALDVRLAKPAGSGSIMMDGDTVSMAPAAKQLIDGKALGM
jgi:hypothetical protein